MKLRVNQDTLINGLWTGVGVGDFDKETADLLIHMGVAEEYETKVEAVTEKKSAALTSSSLPAPQSRKRTSRSGGAKPIK
jgi:hypothetical protein